MKIEKLLIANRGEIARRIIRTCRQMGMATVAVYSDADRDLPFVHEADQAYFIGGAAAKDSYLRADKIIEIARQTGADAIHPGYGFLSENVEFARDVEAAGLIFIGPTPEAISAMALKGAAKALMEAAGVPVTPGYHGEAQDLATLQSEAKRIGYPVLIKAVAGGGGKGMRRVDAASEFEAALISAQREGQNAFANPKVLIEKYITKPRHIEIQLFADRHENVVHLHERDCSLQRRHQKVIEEAPAPHLSPDLRAKMGAAAVAAAKAINYCGAGTVEFIVDVSNGVENAPFYFMEMNTRLQVEHPVTEAITGLDLVEWQIRVAQDEVLPLSQDEIPLSGHALEVRLYAEDPENDFLPATGRLDRLTFPTTARIESAVIEGNAVTPHYDPMIAKIIVHGRDRTEALIKMKRALLDTRVTGLATNLGFLRRVMVDAEFMAGEIDTGFIARRGAPLLEPWPDAYEAHGMVPDSPFSAQDYWWLGQGDYTPIALPTDGGDADDQAHSGQIISPMPGKVIALMVKTGDAVKKGQPLMILEAMKIEHTLKSPFDGVVRESELSLNQQVADKAHLLSLTPDIPS